MSPSQHVLVGYDESPGGDRALRWAVDEARRRRLDLMVCHSWRWPYPVTRVDRDIKEIIRSTAEHLLDRGVAIAREMAPSIKVHRRLCGGAAYAALALESRDAELIVIGSHERDRLSAGSTAMRLPARARRPVVVVRGPAGAHRRVVVGVDGSPGGEAALAFAFEEAALRGWDLQAVHGCWEPGAVAGSDLALYADEEALKRSCHALLEHTVAPYLVKYPQVEASTRLVMAGPRQALLDAAGGAGLVVVGDRGAGRLDRLVLGATSSALLQHAPGTVAVVPSVPRD